MKKFFDQRRNAFVFTVSAFLVWCAAFVFYQQFGHRIIGDIYAQQSVSFLNNVIENRSAPLDVFLRKADLSVFFLSCVYFLAVFSVLCIGGSRIATAVSVYSFFALVMTVIGVSRYGPAVDSDSLNYLFAADNLWRLKGFFNYEGTPFALWPPLYPFLLSLLRLVEFPVLQAAILVNALSFAAITALSGFLMKRFSRNVFLVIAAMAWIVFSRPLFVNGVFVMTEILFSWLVLLHGYYLIRYREVPEKSNFYKIALTAAAALMVRYAGIALVLNGVIFFCFLSGHKKLKDKICTSTGFLFFSLAPFIVWTLRTFVLTGTPTGHRTLPELAVLITFQDMMDVLSLWFLPGFIAAKWRIVVFAIMMTAMVFWVFRNRESGWAKMWIPLGILFFVYCGFIGLYTAMTFHYAVTDRLMVPVYSILVLLIWGVLDDWLERGNIPRAGKRFAVFVLCLWLVYPVIRVNERMTSFLQQGAGAFSLEEWQTSPLIESLRVSPLDGVVYTNSRDVYYYFLDDVTLRSPRYGGLCEGDGDIEEMKQMVRTNEKVYFVWFDNFGDRCLHSPDELKTHFSLQPHRTLPDGRVFLLQ